MYFFHSIILGLLAATCSLQSGVAARALNGAITLVCATEAVLDALRWSFIIPWV